MDLFFLYLTDLYEEYLLYVLLYDESQCRAWYLSLSTALSFEQQQQWSDDVLADPSSPFCCFLRNNYPHVLHPPSHAPTPPSSYSSSPVSLAELLVDEDLDFDAGADLSDECDDPSEEDLDL
jgi:hypothetical protein